MVAVCKSVQICRVALVLLWTRLDKTIKLNSYDN